jgi:hypothetical protein
MTLIRVKVTDIEFEGAKSNGFAYGQDLSRRVKGSCYSVFIRLGEEKPYTYRESEDSSIECRFFKDCSIFYAENDEKVDNEDYLFTLPMVNIIIYK